MLTRTLDATLFNKVANDPVVQPLLGYEGQIDLSNAAANVENFFLSNKETGGFVAAKIADGVYEVHTLFSPTSRPTALSEDVKSGLEYMFLNTDCHTLVTQLPANNKPAEALARHVGFKTVFHRAGALRGPTDFAKLTLDEWVHSNDDLIIDGEWFHSKIENAKLDNGSMLPIHDHDPAHERAVGAAVRMIKANNAFKGVDFYNAWARFAGYAPITLVNDNPVVIDIIDAVVEVKGQDMEIVLCR